MLSRRTKSLRHAVHLAFSGALLATPVAAALVTLPAWAQSSEAAHAFAIAAGSLEAAIAEFSSVAGVTVSFEPAAAQGRRSPGVQGQFSTNEALRRLLEGSGLQAVQQGNGSYSLLPADKAEALQLGATSITDRTLGQTTEGSGSYTTGAMQSATKLPLSVRETPQSVTVITRQRMDDQGMNSLTDAVKNTPGLSVQKWAAERTTFFSRGFQIDNLMYDGLPTIMSRYTPDMTSSVDLAIYDRVEIVRGASGLMQGAGNPSAAINLVRKRPTREAQVSISGLAGSWDTYRTELDASSALNSNGTLRGRTVISYQDRKSYQDVVEAERTLFYAIGEADLGENTTLTLGASNQKDDSSNDWGGVPTAADGSDLHLSRSSFLGNDWAYWDQDNTTVFAELEHRFDNDWKLRLATTHMKADLAFLGSYTSWTPTGLNQYTGNYFYEETQSSYDLYASGPFSMLGRSHELVVGASRRDEDFEGHGGSGQTAANINPYAWDSGSVPKPRYNRYTFHQKLASEEESVYVTTRLNPADDLKIILGARLDWYDYQVKTLSSRTQSGYSVDRELTRYAGVIYDLDEHHSVYVSYTDIFKPQGSLDAQNKVLEPIKGENYEIGIKGEYFDGALNASAALFRIDQVNRAKEVARNLCTDKTRACYEAAGEVRSEGVELEINGALTSNWQLAAGYTFAEAKYRKDSNANNEGKLFDTKVPRHLFKLSTTYQLPGELDRWRVGGTLYKQSSLYSEGNHWRDNRDYRIEQEGYALVDLMLAYQPTEELNLRLNLNNLFDKTYFQSVDTGAQERSVVYGEPRNLTLSAKYRF